MRELLIYISGILLIVSCQSRQQVQSSEPESKDEKGIFEKAYEDAIHWYVIGDFGRNGQFGQQEVADQMGEYSEIQEPDFIVTTGDNIYPNGVASVLDPLWKTSFEDVYRHHNLFCNWYAAIGNHGYRGNPQAQVDYTKISQRWQMPARYYVKNFEDDNISIKIVFLDTNPFEDQYYRQDKYMSVWDQDSTRQLVWMDSVLSDNSADWKIIVGHHPLYSGGKRIHSTGSIKNHLEKVLIKYNVDLYFAGHEHDLQHIHNPAYKTHHIISGAGSDIRETGKMEYTKFAAAQNGFVAASALKDKLLIRFINVKGEVIHHFELNK
ncbi:metallophosphoesterase [Reichenbachiella versicolor]|uniref:metallophosphoesterase n=1 Tax=Reichenbachiella versicolor TaxID=1821036 RepID=UPI000D6E3699|nr:metallophosphoesterase [Reichenbachiella versicolor]